MSFHFLGVSRRVDGHAAIATFERAVRPSAHLVIPAVPHRDQHEQPDEEDDRDDESSHTDR